jgi:hypothetical protein
VLRLQKKCNDGTKLIGSFSEARKTCTTCRNGNVAKRNVVAAAADPNLRICSGCAASSRLRTLRTKPGCNKKQRYSTSEYNTLKCLSRCTR